VICVSRPQFFIALRWFTAIATGLCALKLLIWATHASSYVAGFAGALLGFSALITAGLLLAPELAGWAATPVHRAINNLIFPGGSVTPPADYTLARLYRKQWRYRESVEEYLKILEYHPEELAAYLEGIATAAEANGRKTRERFYRLGLRKLRNTEAREQLRQAFASSRVCDAAQIRNREDEVSPPV
jgi:tetratricopeptide (TPR) repeat protein